MQVPGYGARLPSRQTYVRKSKFVWHMVLRNQVYIAKILHDQHADCKVSALHYEGNALLFYPTAWGFRGTFVT